jgi:hypothetical protein
VYGVFTRALREADRRRRGAYSVHEKQGLVPDLQFDDSHYELKGIHVDSSRTIITMVGCVAPVSPPVRCRQEGAEHR